ncbi:MAG: 2,3-bisphosphoglycerate-independent phosphoglycerate mutase [Myxococcota bacterium]|nr:2,3-bisphosphoglycerate-independent phosphoglycerate mutase [Myxococcota bacterium]
MQNIVLCILDGFGWGNRDDGDAVFTAKTPCLDQLQLQYPWNLLKAHGTAVGMPSDGDMGNSEVGHNAMGAGRIFSQGAKLVNQAIENGTMWKSDAWSEISTRKTLHLLGLLSDGNVHSHIHHLLALIAQAHEAEIEKVYVHVLTDGRDVDPRSALTYIETLENALRKYGSHYRIATGGGRMNITMDRYEADWEMVKRGYDCHVHAKGPRFESASEAVRHFYNSDSKLNDQTLPSFVIGDYQGMQDGDAVVFYNFRGDRAIEISRALEEEHFSFFDRGRHPNLFFAGMMEYDGDLKVPKNYLVPPPLIDDTVGERMSAAGKRVLAISETQKFGHVTFFFNGNKSGALAHETQTEVDSFNVSFDEKPQMSAMEVTDLVCEAIESQQYDHIRLNLANGDMVGHTGNFSATVEAIEYLDVCVSKIYASCKSQDAILLITADHGNADEMFQFDAKKGTYKEKNGARIPSTSHSKNPVPLIFIDPLQNWTLKSQKGSLAGGLAQIGGTLLDLSGLPVPKHYLESLVEKQ